jgi:hypothetical protein
VASPDSPYLTIIRTDLDIVDTTVLVEGNIVDVRVTTQNGSQGNTNAVSRVPGYGEPCNLPPTLGNPDLRGHRAPARLCRRASTYSRSRKIQGAILRRKTGPLVFAVAISGYLTVRRGRWAAWAYPIHLRFQW